MPTTIPPDLRAVTKRHIPFFSQSYDPIACIMELKCIYLIPISYVRKYERKVFQYFTKQVRCSNGDVTYLYKSQARCYIRQSHGATHPKDRAVIAEKGITAPLIDRHSQKKSVSQSFISNCISLIFLPCLYHFVKSAAASTN